MKHVAPFLGIPAEPRRKYLRAAWVDLPIPTSEQLGRAARQLMQLPEREYHYAAYDLLVKYLANANEHFLAEHVQVLLVTKPWWDTVDGLVNAGVSPLARRYESTALIDAWSESGNIWLIRAAIGHQRGWRTDTDVDRVFAPLRSTLGERGVLRGQGNRLGFTRPCPFGSARGARVSCNARASEHGGRSRGQPGPEPLNS